MNKNKNILNETLEAATGLYIFHVATEYANAEWEKMPKKKKDKYKSKEEFIKEAREIFFKRYSNFSQLVLDITEDLKRLFLRGE